MTYAKIENGTIIEFPVTEGDIRLRYPNCSFPNPFVAPDGYEFVEQSQFPQIDYTKNVSEGEPLLVNGVWTQNWVVVDAEQEQIAARIEREWISVRGNRNTELANSDWTQLPDAPVDAAIWAEYRQALRDITNQSDPFAIQWPVKPA